MKNLKSDKNGFILYSRKAVLVEYQPHIFLLGGPGYLERLKLAIVDNLGQELTGIAIKVLDDYKGVVYLVSVTIEKNNKYHDNAIHYNLVKTEIY